MWPHSVRRVWATLLQSPGGGPCLCQVHGEKQWQRWFSHPSGASPLPCHPHQQDVSILTKLQNKEYWLRPCAGPSSSSLATRSGNLPSLIQINLKTWRQSNSSCQMAVGSKTSLIVFPWTNGGPWTHERLGTISSLLTSTNKSYFHVKANKQKRIRLAMQGTLVLSLVLEHPTCHKATKPRGQNYWGHTLRLLKPLLLEPVVCSKRSPWQGPMHHGERSRDPCRI